MNDSEMKIDPRSYDRALSCVHCGLCLPACPTYLLTGHEAQSPRGRIQLIRGIADGVIQPNDVVREHLDACLDCRGCETACPSSVVYHELIEALRDRLSDSQNQRGLRWVIFNILVHPARLRIAVWLARQFRKTGLQRMLPEELARFMSMLPGESELEEKPIAPGQITAGQITAKAAPTSCSVAFFSGCVGSVLCGRLNQQCVELLELGGARVARLVPQCCGAMHQHDGRGDDARELARRNIDAILPPGGAGADYIITHIAGCGSTLRDYGMLLRDDPRYAARAAEFATKVMDISQMLVRLSLPPMTHAIEATAAYHDACHLVHAQKVSAQPRELLRRIPGLKLAALAESDVCCGAAGSYNLTHPTTAGQLADRKLDHFAASKAEILVAGNIGCALHLQARAAARGIRLRVAHPAQLVHAAIFGKQNK